MIAYDRNNVALFEAKWKDLSRRDARKILRDLDRKGDLVPLKGVRKLGLIARNVNGKKEFRDGVFLIFDLGDVLPPRRPPQSPSRLS